MLNTDQLPTLVQPVVTRYWQRWQEQSQTTLADIAAKVVAKIEQSATLSEELARVWAASDYAANLCIQRPAALLNLLNSQTLEKTISTEFSALLAEQLGGLLTEEAPRDDSRLKQVLRHFQQEQMLRIIWRDVCGKAEVMETCADMSALADACLQNTLRVLHQWCAAQWGEPVGESSGLPQSLIVIGMGKLGANELNLSSDIDLVFAYPEAGTTQGKPDSLSNQQFFTRLGQALIDALDATTPDGFVFRVDMRLRPYGSEGALVCSFDAMENYYQSQGRDWERYAMIKARIVAGDQQQGKELLSRLRPFVYRRYLDFSTFDSLRSMKLQINKQVRRRGMSQDIKLGPGGIREIEFIVQALQLVHGGRDSSLQTRSLHQALIVLGEHAYLPQNDLDELWQAYLFLRKLENSLQALANKQTQLLVKTALEQQRIAFALGFTNWEEMMTSLDSHRKKVMSHFKSVIHSDEEEELNDLEEERWLPFWKMELAEEAALAMLTEEGFEAAEQTFRQIVDFRKSRNFLVLPAESLLRFDRFMPVLLQAVAESQTPSQSFSRVMTLVEAVSRRTAYLVLLIENPGALREMIQLCTGSPFIAEFLSKHPVLLDELLGGISEPPERKALQAELQQRLLRIGEEDFEEQMEYLRYFKQSHTLQVAAAQISGKMTVMKVSDYLTFIAEVILEQVVRLSWEFLVRKHGYPVNKQGEHGQMDFAVIAYGKLGGIELSYLSDLDLVFLHEGDLNENTVADSRQKPINSREFYTRLTQRIIMMLGTSTVSGRLYEIDMRLRPSGESGLLISTLESFQHYQQNEAWTWEHQALVRSRAVAGNQELMSNFARVRSEILAAAREPAELQKEVVAMRQRMREELGRKAGAERDKPGYAIKQGEGGIVDIEFIVQYLVLANSHAYPQLLDWPDNIRILDAVAECQLLPEEDIKALAEAYLALRSALHRFALQQEERLDCLQELEADRTRVIAIWRKVFTANE
ncbi:MAG: bifunctional [glutamate--ammonia ligase]-adenylyl-L-tyrosine phosphorylase/[glutamate--ammonia-ligase] adenylyltransferase [Pseudomonadales bacterium]|nr:bifunctional [glutamate--ammonia ligase]-adenylyl-L-tyrosine phosphorylase/[glutamate--ammonia-ligase] adenylyltransferase [Pseudomonadales bacterium]